MFVFKTGVCLSVHVGMTDYNLIGMLELNHLGGEGKKIISQQKDHKCENRDQTDSLYIGRLDVQVRMVKITFF